MEKTGQKREKAFDLDVAELNPSAEAAEVRWRPALFVPVHCGSHPSRRLSEVRELVRDQPLPENAVQYPVPTPSIGDRNDGNSALSQKVIPMPKNRLVAREMFQ
jgi:hypothetical protein